MSDPTRLWYTPPTDVNVACEQTTPDLTGTVKDEDGTTIAGTSLITLTLTLYNKTDGAVINGRNAQNVLNQNQVTVTAQGVLTFAMLAADNPIVDTTLAAGSREVHAALFTYTWLDGSVTKTGRHLIEFYVEQLAKVS